MPRLPDFLRVAWVGDRARNAWAPRLEAIRAAWPRVLAAEPSASGAPCALLTVPPWLWFRLDDDARRAGRSAAILGTRGLSPSADPDPRPPGGAAGRPFRYDVAVGGAAACAHAGSLWRAGRFAAALGFAGAPECCAAAAERDAALGRGEAIARYLGGEPSAAAGPEAMSDPLWRWAGIGPLPYAPCTPRCAAARARRDALTAAARRRGFSDEMGWLDEILSWPAEWTALHGIAELKTPVLKALWPTDVAHAKSSFRFFGEGYPDEGAAGLGFPFRSPARPRLTASRPFRRGMDNAIAAGGGDAQAALRGRT